MFPGSVVHLRPLRFLSSAQRMELKKKKKKIDKVRSSLSRLAPAGLISLWKLKSQRKEVKIEEGRLKREGFFNIYIFSALPLWQILRNVLFSSHSLPSVGECAVVSGAAAFAGVLICGWFWDSFPSPAGLVHLSDGSRWAEIPSSECSYAFQNEAKVALERERLLNRSTYAAVSST